MKIEIRAIKLAPFLSQETNAYSAQIWINGDQAFHASNAGHGGCDNFHRLPSYTGPDIPEIDEWLRGTEPPFGPFEPDQSKRQPYDLGHNCDLEMFISTTIDELEARKKLVRLMKTRAVFISHSSQVFSVKAPSIPQTEAIVLKSNPGARMISDVTSGDFLEAVKIVADTNRAATLYERQRSNNLTRADAIWLISQDEQTGKPDPEFHDYLRTIIARDDARYSAYQSERDSTRRRAI